MSSCPRTEHGQTLCNIVDHPDRPRETFCATCQQRFVKRDYGSEFAGMVAAGFALLLLLLVTRSPVRYASDIREEETRREIQPLPANVVPEALPSNAGENDLPSTSGNVAIAATPTRESSWIKVIPPPQPSTEH